MKKIVAILAFMLSVISMGMIDTFAISLNEIEELATGMEFNVPITDSLKTEGSENWYKFVVTEQGYFQLNFSLTNNTDVSSIGYGWNINIYSGKDIVNILKSYSSVKNNMKTPKMAFEPGDYYVKVSGVYGKAAGCKYSLGMNFTADTTWEFENNSTQETANLIEVNKVYNGQLLSKQDVDWYKVEIAEIGILTINFLLNADTDANYISGGWNIYFYDKDMNVVRSYTGVKSEILSNDISFDAGTYYVKVQGVEYYQPVDCAYSIKMNYIPLEYWESENNDTNEKADEIKTNQAYNGMLHDRTDVDWYKVNIEHNGYFKVKFQVDEKTNKENIRDGWKISILDENLNTLKEYNGVKDNMLGAELPYQIGTYYVKVEAYDNYYVGDSPVDCIYSICIVSEVSNSWEIEGNNDLQSSNLIPSNKMYSGILHGQKDVDWYKVKIETKGYFQLQFKVDENVNKEKIVDGWKVLILDSNQNVIKEYGGVVNSFESGVLPYQTGEYYVKVEAYDNYYVGDSPVDCIYSICIVSEVSNSWEVEENNDEGFANEIYVNKTYSGTLHGQKDIDWYKVSIGSKGYFQLKFEVAENVNKENIHDGWRVSILDNKQNIIKEYGGVGSSFESGVLPYQTGEYYVKVEAYDNYYVGDSPVDCIYSICVVSEVSNSWEVEENNDLQSANVVASNKTYRGTLHGQKDVDWYKVKIGTKGYFQLQFKVDGNVNKENIRDGWKVAILDDKQNIIKEYVGIGNSFNSGVLPYKTGEYFVKVEAYDNYYVGDSPVDCIYSICVVNKASNNWEIEGTNDTSSVAATATNKTVQGTLYKNKDADWYKFNISNTGYFQLKFDIDKNVVKENIKQGWKITIFDKNLNEIKKYEKVTTKVTSGAIPYPKGTYYVKVETQNDYGNNAPVDCIYSVHMVTRASSSFETENNNEKSKADTISVNKEYHGILTNATDEDWYKFTVPSNGKVLLKFSKHSTVASSTVGFGWNVEIYQGTKLIQKYETLKTSFKYTADLKKGTYYVKVKAQSTYGTNSPVDRRYSVKVSFTAKPAASSIKTISTKSKTVTLNWYQSSKATGYYVYRATTKNGTYRKIVTIKSKATVKYTDKNNLKKGTRYYYKIVAYTTSNGLTVSATAGAVKSIQVK